MSEWWVHEAAAVEADAEIGGGTKVWDGARVRAGARIGSRCVIGRGVFVDAGVLIGDNTKVQNNAQLYSPAVLGRGVFIGPAAVLTNDRHPRAVDPDGLPLTAGRWDADGVRVMDGAAVGAGAVVVAGVTVERWGMVAAGAVVARDVRAFELVGGVPARHLGWVGRAGTRLERADSGWRCPRTGEYYREAGIGLELVT